jgi:pyruvate formate lyase activating enzyme
LFQPDFLLALLRACKGKEIHVALDTCGYASWEVMDQIRELVDVFLYDLKLMDEARHLEYTGVSNQPILSNLRMLSERGHDIVIRIPVIPGVNDDSENVRQIGEFAAVLPHVNGTAHYHQVHLLPYHHIAIDKYRRLNRIYPLAEIHPPSEESMAEISQILHNYDLSVKIGG